MSLPLPAVEREKRYGFVSSKTRNALGSDAPFRMTSVATLTKVAPIPIEVWGWGRLPLAISGRCYHARLHDRAKDNCQFVCGIDPDGRDVDTLDGQDFLAVNGVQTLSATRARLPGTTRDPETICGGSKVDPREQLCGQAASWPCTVHRDD